MSWLIEAYLEEGKNDSEKGLPEFIDFFGKKFHIHISSYYGNDEKAKANTEKIKSALKAFCSAGLYNYLVKANSSWMDEINSDPYFQGKTCKSGKDLIDAIKNDPTNANKGFAVFVKENDGVLNIFIGGEYWLDPEHGFSINFPNGKFTKCPNEKSISGYPKYTGIGGFDMAL